MATTWNTLDTAAVETLLGFLDPAGPLIAHLRELAPGFTDAIAELLTNGIALGLNPREIGMQMTNLSGMALTSAMRHARTAQLWSYREANRAQYLANSHLVTGWTWYAALDDRVCLSCIALHGTEYSLAEPLDDHYNGRCRMIPNVSWQSAGIELPALNYGPTGAAWFETLNPDQQEAIMGPGRYDAWTAGRFDFAKLTKQVEDPLYGHMRIEASLADLVQEAA
jgi:hypothetical protein